MLWIARAPLQGPEEARAAEQSSEYSGGVSLRTRGSEAPIVKSIGPVVLEIGTKSAYSRTATYRTINRTQGSLYDNLTCCHPNLCIQISVVTAADASFLCPLPQA